jgi:hypothetical protein
MRQAVEALTPIIRKKSPQKSAKSTDQTEVAQKLVDLLSKLLKTS